MKVFLKAWKVPEGNSHATEEIKAEEIWIGPIDLEKMLDLLDRVKVLGDISYEA